MASCAKTVSENNKININDIVQHVIDLETAIINRFNIGPGRSIVSAINTRTFTSNWSTQAQCTLTATFSNADQARHFFNSGGKIRILSSRTGGAPTQQNNAWTNILSSVGLKEFGANTNPIVNFYTLTNVYQTFHQNSLSTPYSANNYRLEARCNVSNNSNGTATVVEIRVSLNDLYVDPASPPHTPSTVLPIDSIDGTLSIVYVETKQEGKFVISVKNNKRIDFEQTKQMNFKVRGSQAPKTCENLTI
jgi:hypothetical protein